MSGKQVFSQGENPQWVQDSTCVFPDLEELVLEHWDDVKGSISLSSKQFPRLHTLRTRFCKLSGLKVDPHLPLREADFESTVLDELSIPTHSISTLRLWGSNSVLETLPWTQMNSLESFKFTGFQLPRSIQEWFQTHTGNLQSVNIFQFSKESQYELVIAAKLQSLRVHSVSIVTLKHSLSLRSLRFSRVQQFNLLDQSEDFRFPYLTELCLEDEDLSLHSSLWSMWETKLGNIGAPQLRTLILRTASDQDSLLDFRQFPQLNQITCVFHTQQVRFLSIQYGDSVQSIKLHTNAPHVRIHGSQQPLRFVRFRSHDDYSELGFESQSQSSSSPPSQPFALYERNVPKEKSFLIRCFDNTGLFQVVIGHPKEMNKEAWYKNSFVHEDASMHRMIQAMQDFPYVRTFFSKEVQRAIERISYRMSVSKNILIRSNQSVYARLRIEQAFQQTALIPRTLSELSNSCSTRAKAVKPIAQQTLDLIEESKEKPLFQWIHICNCLDHLVPFMYMLEKAVGELQELASFSLQEKERVEVCYEKMTEAWNRRAMFRP